MALTVDVMFRPELSASLMKSTDRSWLAGRLGHCRTLLRFRPRLPSLDSVIETK